ncbi:uncharacterized protein LOC129584160 [Paramacrobiotus metropolitanus]|uniref:uncharacterized protein LOC129584160 n=1 Tax=Paramacrobiotus metropolitanus TaxID=2943436 RepID=UPI002445B7B1|nr:uncharacterized protein LOC129584160 [Paramacrobiotus metropolitanus]
MFSLYRIRVTGCFIYVLLFIRICATENASPPWQLTEFLPATPPSSCSEFAHIRNSKANKSDGDRRILLLCNDQTADEQNGFRGLELECSPRDAHKWSSDGQQATGYVGEQLFAISTKGRVRMIKAFVVANRSFVVVLIERSYSFLYEVLEDDKGIVQIVKLQTIPYNYLSDVTAVYVSTGDVYVAFAAFEPEGVDKTRLQDMIAPVYRLHNARLKLCDFAGVTRSVAVRGWEHEGGFPTLAYAAYLEKESDKSAINFFDVFMDDEGSCRVAERHFQSSIKEVNDRQLCGIQSIEVLQKDAIKYLAVALSPVDQNQDCGHNAMTESFIFQTDDKARHRFMVDRYIRFPAAQTRFSGFRLIKTSCNADVIQAFGYFSKTLFFTAEQFEDDKVIFLKRIARLDTPPNVWHSSVGYCSGQRALLALSRPDLFGVPVLELHCGGYDAPQTRPNRNLPEVRTDARSYYSLKDNDENNDRPESAAFRNVTFPTLPAYMDVTPDNYVEKVEKSEHEDDGDDAGRSTSHWHGIVSYKLWKKKQGNSNSSMVSRPSPAFLEQNQASEIIHPYTQSPVFVSSTVGVPPDIPTYSGNTRYQNVSLPLTRPSFRTLGTSPNLFLSPSMLNNGSPVGSNRISSGDTEPDPGTLAFDQSSDPPTLAHVTSEPAPSSQEYLLPSSHIPPASYEPPFWSQDIPGNTSTVPPSPLINQPPVYPFPGENPPNAESYLYPMYPPNPPTVPVRSDTVYPNPYPQPPPGIYDFPKQPPMYYPEMSYRPPYLEQRMPEYGAPAMGPEQAMKENGRWGGGKSKGLRRYKRRYSAPG